MRVSHVGEADSLEQRIDTEERFLLQLSLIPIVIALSPGILWSMVMVPQTLRRLRLIREGRVTRATLEQVDVVGKNRVRYGYAFEAETTSQRHTTKPLFGRPEDVLPRGVTVLVFFDGERPEEHVWDWRAQPPRT